MMTFKPQVNEDEPIDFDNKTLLVIDGDEIAFKVAAACEKRSVVATNKVSNVSAVFDTRTQLKDFLKGLEVPEGFFAIEDKQVADSPKFAKSSLKAKIMNLRAKFKTKDVEIYLGGVGNFRDDIPLPLKYKSNRQDTLRPLLLKEMREYLIEHQGAVVVNGVEADDVLCQRAWDGMKTNKKIVAITQDKDSFSFAGWIYNPEKDEKSSYSNDYGSLWLDNNGDVKGRGRIWLQHQILLGDSADFYKPTDLVKIVKGKVKAFGQKSSYTLLKDCTTDKEGWEVVHTQYLAWFGEEPFTYACWKGEEHTIDYIDALQMYFDCARMRRWENDVVCIRSVLKKLGVIE